MNGATLEFKVLSGTKPKRRNSKKALPDTSQDDKATNSNGEDGLDADYVLTVEGGAMGGDTVIGSGKVQRK